MRAIKPTELKINQKAMLDLAYNGETLLVARPAKKNVVVISEMEFNELAKARRNLEYLAKLDGAIEDAKENGGYEFDLNTRTFSDTPVKINL
jgi:antitoxin YefM